MARGDEWTLTARWIFPVDGPPLHRGTVTIRGDRLVAVEPRGGRAADRDFGNAAILPGLVNAHTHLDLSDLRGRVPPTKDFTGWLRAITAHRRGRTAEQVQRAIADGVEECVRFGTTLVGDIAAAGASAEILAAAPLRSVVFFELIGLSAERAEESLNAVRTWLETHRGGDTCRPGVSPHAPYTVRRALFARAAGLAAERGLALAVHLAETQAELELLQTHRGPLHDFLREIGAWNPGGMDLAADAADVLALCNEDIPKLLVHANYLEPSTPLPPRSTIVYCPRTHAAFGHAPHPFRDLFKRGVRVALGTDSLASNPDLDVLAEARYLCARYPDFPGDTLLRMATLSGAEALAWDADTGSLAPGKSADLVVLPLPTEDAEDPHGLLFASAAAVEKVLWRGQWSVG